MHYIYAVIAILSPIAAAAATPAAPHPAPYCREIYLVVPNVCTRTVVDVRGEKQLVE